MRFHVLGPLEVCSNGTALALRRGRVRPLVHLLLLHRRTVVPTEVVAERLWPGDELMDGANAVHQLVSYLRRALGPDGREVLETTPVGYRLDVADEHVDAWQFAALVQAAAGAAPDTALADVESALRLWRGEPLAESADHEWAAGDRARLHDLYLQAQEVRVEALLGLGRHGEAAVEAQSLSAAYPLRERFHAQHALALYRSGRQAEALEVHRSVRRLLADELGLDPGADLRRLEQAMLQQDPALEWSGPLPPKAVREVPAEAPQPATDRSAAPPPAGPPVAALPLVGRDADLRVAAERSALSTVYTVVGPAGVGKSRLATCLVQQVAGDAAVWYVDVGDLGEDGHVAGAVADRLGLHEELPPDPLQRLVRAFSMATGTLVLDNCDDVVDGVAGLARSLTSAAPGLRVLATSRRPLGVPGEVVHRLAPLPLPGDADPATVTDNPAVALFIDRARHADAGFGLDADAVGDVVALVRLLDGLPMAIELAAAHVDVSSVPAIRRRLESDLDTLTPAGPASASRDGSLAAAIGSSTRRLTADERSFLLALAVFPGSFDVEAAAAVAGVDDTAAYTLLASLVRQSLVSAERPGDRYRLLAPVRSYAAALAGSAPETRTTSTRHVDWLAGVAWRTWEASRGERQPEELAALRGLLPDARVALGWALQSGHTWGAVRIGVAFAWLWTLHGLAQEGFGWLVRVKELSDRIPVADAEHARDRAILLRSLGLLANPLGRMDLARDVCAEAADISLAHGDRAGAAAALLTRGVALWALDDQQDAAATFSRAADLARDEPASWNHVAARVLRARTALDGGEPGAEQMLDEAVELAQVVGERQMLGFALACRARWQLTRAAVQSASLTAQEALRIWADIGYLEGEMMARNILARCLLRSGDPAAAETEARRALRVARDTGHRGATCESLESLALAAAASCRREHALLLLTVATRERRRLGAPVPAGDRGAVESLREALQLALAGAADLAVAQAELTLVDDLVARLLD